MQLDNATIKRLKGIGHDLKPIVMIGNKGITPSITEEIDRALTDHELIKVKLPAGTKEERDVIGAQLAVLAEMRHQWRHAPAEQALEHAARFGAHPLLALENRAVQVAAAILGRLDGAFLEQAIEQRLDRGYLPALLADEGGDHFVGRHGRAGAPQYVHHQRLGVTDRYLFIHRPSPCLIADAISAP